MPTIAPELIAFIAIAYVFLLFYIAYVGDKQPVSPFLSRNKSIVYSLSLAVYCSSWTFFGAVGSAARDGWEFFAIYLGPIIVFIFGYRFIQRIIILSKQQNITSISDFLSSRFGKNRTVAVWVTLIAVIGSLPYISLQLHAISLGFSTLSTASENLTASPSFWKDTAFYSTILLAFFSIFFGTRHLNATEHHRGMMNAVAFESLVKLLAMLLVGYLAITLVLAQFSFQQITNQPFQLSNIGSSESTFSWLDFGTKLLLSMGAIILLPRQFQVAVVEADDHHQMKTARWLLPIYLLLISIAVIPIALAGLLLLPTGGNADLFVLHLPQNKGFLTLALIAFIGGISAATGMVIVASISISTMVCNDVIMPILIRSHLVSNKRQDLSRIILIIRRISIVLIMLAAYGYLNLSGNNQQLANMGLLSFAAIIQLAPALIAGMYWRRANQNGVNWGLGLGFTIWAYCLLMPNFTSAQTLNALFAQISWLHPHHLFNVPFSSSLTHGVFWSLLVNVSGLVIGSFRFAPSMLDKIQASLFTHAHISSSPNQQFVAKATVKNARVLCENIIGINATQKLLSPYVEYGQLTPKIIQNIERAIAGVIGASSARHIITTQLLGDDVTAEDLFVMMDETTQALQFNQDILQASFENMSQGISVVDKKLRLVAWNSRYQSMFDYPTALLNIGTPIENLIRFSAERGDCGPGDIDQIIERRLSYLRTGNSYTSERERHGVYIKINGNPIPGGGFVTSFTDVTEQKTSAALSEKLQSVTVNKTQFLAAASHDLLQPINAARLFTNSLIDRPDIKQTDNDILLKKIDSSLVNADKLLRALLDISKLDTGVLRPKIRAFSIDDILQELKTELTPLALQKGLSIKFMPSRAMVSSDQTLLRSILQNLISNAIRYTQNGKVLVGCRAQAGHLHVHILDTGCGIDDDDLENIFVEFYRIKNTSSRQQGLGLGLAITKRLSNLLAHPITVQSIRNKGSHFNIRIPRYFGEVIKLAKQSTWAPASKLQGLSIIYLENAVASREAMTALLTNWGCKIHSYETYQQALMAVKSSTFKIDLILADYQLDNEETGLDFLYHAQTILPAINGVLVTAEQDSAIKEQTLQSGYTFLAKPVDPAALRSILTSIVRSVNKKVPKLIQRNLLYGKQP